ncbi:Uncharacterised protein [BD1-7 clade bacterium]|uniref:N-acetyltransferase domain-containing protein n=1 Tax=BD1-7 clade bacterium TaxID=2029982 RepID=A0A5S9PJP0_9GAMM|nr:Uncharacterised protein [BD1-7 clade bacterium]
MEIRKSGNQEIRKSGNQEIRKSETQDLEQLKALSRKTISICYPCFMGDEVVSGYINSGASDEEIEKHSENTYVAINADVILGYVVVIDNLVHIMMVDPSQQRIGIGCQLLEFAENDIRKNGFTPTLETFENNTQAVNFYLKNGWTITQKKKDSDFDFVRVYFNKES